MTPEDRESVLPGPSLSQSLIRPFRVGQSWPRGGRIQKLDVMDGAYRLDVVAGVQDKPIRVFARPHAHPGGSFGKVLMRTRRFIVSYLPPGDSAGHDLRFLVLLAKLIARNDESGLVPLPPATAPEPRRDGRIHVPFDLNRLKSRLARWSGPIDEILIVISEPCSQACAFCPESDLAIAGRESPFDSKEQLEQLTAQIRLNREIGAPRLHMTANDPLHFPFLPELVEAGRSSGFTEIVVQTPGLKLADRELVARLAEAGVTSFDMTFYSCEPNLFENMTGVKGALTLAEKAVGNLLAAGIRPRLHTLAVEATLGSIAPTIRYVRDRFGLPLSVAHFIPHQQGPEKFKHMIPPYEALRPVIREFPESFIHPLDFPACLLPDEDRPKEPLRKSTLNLYEMALPFERLDSDWRPTLERVFPAMCEGCRLRSRCPGTYQVYLDRYGTAGLAPVREVDDSGP